MSENNKIVLFLGSGATAGSGDTENGQPVPTDSKFFENLPKQWEIGYPALNLYRDVVHKETSLYKTWNDLFIYRSLVCSGIVREKPETLHRFNDLANHKWPENYNWRAGHYSFQFRLMNQSLLPDEYYLAELAIWDLRTLVKEVYGVEKSNGVYKNFLENVNSKFGEICAVVNLNYDTTFDDADGVQYYYPGDGKSMEGKIPIIRPHGSLKWTSRSQWRLNQGWTGWSESYDDTPLKETGYKPTGDPMLLDFRQALIVSPASFKEEVVGNSSMPGLQNTILRPQWEHLKRAMENYNHWVFVGISFASGDDHLLWLLKRSFNKSKTKISCFIKDSCQPVQKLKECLGKGVGIAVYKNNAEEIDEFKKCKNFKECQKPKCDH